MQVLKGIYNKGVIDLFDKPKFQEPIEVIIIFPEKQKKIKKIGGLFKNFTIDYEKMEKDLKELSRSSEDHLLSEIGDEK